MFIINLLVLSIASFFQNMAFTLVSRSRNAGDVKYHFYCALLSNAIWSITYFLVLKEVWKVLESGNWFNLIIVFGVYSISTSLGSVTMMKYLLKKETGKRKVGAR